MAYRLALALICSDFGGAVSSLQVICTEHAAAAGPCPPRSQREEG
jgi:hypothetical protein